MPKKAETCLPQENTPQGREMFSVLQMVFS
jgi:hypothetical protein